MKTFSILTAVSLVILASSLAAGQTNRGNPREGQDIYEKQCLRCHGEFVHQIVAANRTDISSVKCVNCHRTVGHGPSGAGG